MIQRLQHCPLHSGQSRSAVATITALLCRDLSNLPLRASLVFVTQRWQWVSWCDHCWPHAGRLAVVLESGLERGCGKFSGAEKSHSNDTRAGKTHLVRECSASTAHSIARVQQRGSLSWCSCRDVWGSNCPAAWENSDLGSSGDQSFNFQPTTENMSRPGRKVLKAVQTATACQQGLNYQNFKNFGDGSHQKMP